VIQGAFDRSTSGTTIWVGESGILTAIVDVVLVVLIVRGFSFRPAATETPK
jgi:hypothetical protein